MKLRIFLLLIMSFLIIPNSYGSQTLKSKVDECIHKNSKNIEQGVECVNNISELKGLSDQGKADRIVSLYGLSTVSLGSSTCGSCDPLSCIVLGGLEKAFCNALYAIDQKSAQCYCSNDSKTPCTSPTFKCIN